MSNNNLIQQAAANTNLAKQTDGKATMQQYIKQMEGEIKKALPSVLTPERFTRIVLSALCACGGAIIISFIKSLLGAAGHPAAPERSP